MSRGVHDRDSKPDCRERGERGVGEVRVVVVFQTRIQNEEVWIHSYVCHSSFCCFVLFCFARGNNKMIIDNFCTGLFSGVHKITALYNILQHFLSRGKNRR